MEATILLDYDGIISQGKRSLLEEMGWDLARKASPIEKAYLYGMVAPTLKTLKKLTTKDKENSDRINLKAYEKLVFNVLKPYCRVIDEEIPKYSKSILKEAEEFFRQYDGEVYVISTGAPKQIVEDCLNFKRIKANVIANELDISREKYIGFKKKGFFSDRIGKKSKAKEILENSDKFAIGAGDSYADIGIAEVIYDKEGIFYSIEEGDIDLRDYVMENFGRKYIRKNPKELFNKLQKVLKNYIY